MTKLEKYQKALNMVLWISHPAITHIPSVIALILTTYFYFQGDKILAGVNILGGLAFCVLGVHLAWVRTQALKLEDLRKKGQVNSAETRSILEKLK